MVALIDFVGSVSPLSYVGISILILLRKTLSPSSYSIYLGALPSLG